MKGAGAMEPTPKGWGWRVEDRGEGGASRGGMDDRVEENVRGANRRSAGGVRRGEGRVGERGGIR